MRRHRLRRGLFAWFGLTILVTALVVGAIMHQLGGPKHWRKEGERIRNFVSHRFAERWHDPAGRSALAKGFADDFNVRLELTGPSGESLGTYGGPCERSRFEVPVTKDATRLGMVRVCANRDAPFAGSRWLLPLLGAAAVLWIASGVVARHLSQPLGELVLLAERLGAGDLQARAQLDRRVPSEVALLGNAMHRMGERIEQQLADQRRLLAAVSHELRTPLGHLRILSELLAEKAPAAQPTIDELEKELAEMDALVGDLLAQSRLDFSALRKVPLDAQDLARRALERMHIEPSRLRLLCADTHITADPTLLGRALANLIDNAQKHGRGLTALVLRERTAGLLAFEAEDEGPGFSDDPTAGPTAEEGSGLGLGLELVARIARAHGGHLIREPNQNGGSRVGLEIPRSA